MAKNQLSGTKEFKDEVRSLIDSGYSEAGVDGTAIAILRLRFEEKMKEVKDETFKPKTPETRL